MDHHYRIIAALTCAAWVTACGGGGPSAPSTSEAPMLTLSTATGAVLGVAGTVTVTPIGTPPYQGVIFGACGKLDTTTTSSSFVATISSGLCTLVVQDAAGRVRAIEIGGSPPRAFLGITPTVAPDQTGTVHLFVGATMIASVDEPLVGGSFNTPYAAVMQGSCAALSGGLGAPAGSKSFNVTGTAVGQCVLVATDAAGQATALNVMVP